MDAEDGNGNADAPTWAALFARATPHEVEESAVRETLARRREDR